MLETLNEKQFISELSRLVGKEDYTRESIKKRFPDFKAFMRKEFFFNCPVIIVGGTNGKGAVVQNLEKLALKNQLKPAVWTSPHIESLTERFRYNGKNIGFDLLADFVCKELEKKDFALSFFEVLFVAFCRWAQNCQPDLLILEVGLGGRLDATNVFEPAVSLITSISRDHTAYLGNSYREILEEKFPIARKEGFFIGQSPLQFIRDHMEKLAQKLGCEYQIFQQEKDQSYQEINWLLACQVFERLYPKLSTEFQADQRVEAIATIEFNGAHNIDGMRQLMRQLCQQKNLGKKIDHLLLAFSQRDPQELKTLIAIVKKHQVLFRSIELTYFSHPRSLSLKQSRQLAEDHAIVFQNKWKNRLDEAIREKQQLMVAGSYYFVGEARAFLHHRP